ncbi:MAG: helix-turn-helix transcriptional regulator [Clostridia bacterium]|nr:helix-turn-helix transcriptional regulator [Clostridia bacterium]MBR3716062.1 helix-turn-helix transcriptional regulator [Clostridia bacterium]
MQSYEIETLPRVKFAHVYHASRYFNSLQQKEDSMEVTFISEGSITIVYKGKEYIASKGDIVCLPYDTEQISIKAYDYHEHHTVLAQLKWSLCAHTNGLYLPIVTPSHLGTKSAESIIDQMIHDNLLFKNSPTIGASKFLDLLCEIDQCNRKQQNKHLPSEVLYAQRAKKYVQENLHSPITQKNVAQYLSISPEYLCSVFKKVEGISFQKYVNYEKLEAIRHLIEQEPIHLYEASSLFGYSDPNYVSRLFKKYYGYNITERSNEHTV